VLGDVLAPCRREVVGVRDHLLERPVLLDQLTGRLVADPRDAGDVVARVALEPDEVRNLVGPDPVAGLDALGRVDVHVGDARGVIISVTLSLTSWNASRSVETTTSS
jgi:hypothetical protein